MLHESTVEDLVAPRPADTVVRVYAHDVQQDMAAHAPVFAHARPGTRGSRRLSSLPASDAVIEAPR
jgi:hypothetical protein